MTNFSHPKCYARSLNDCSKTISGEHYISEGILKQYDGKILVYGLGQNGREASPNSLTVNVLCTKHNSYLSDFDSEAIKLFSTIEKFDKDIDVPDGTYKYQEIDGRKLERWILKASYALAESGSFQKDNQKMSVNIKEVFLEVLFQGQPFPKLCGLYFISKLGDKVHVEKSISIRPITNGEKLIAVEILFRQLGFMLCLEEPSEPTIRNTFHCPGFIFQDHKETTRREIKLIYT